MGRLSKIGLAVLNSARWYEDMFAAHGLASETDGRVWRSRENPPAFHSNLVILAPATTEADIDAFAAEIERWQPHTGWSLKDSYARFDLASRGCSMLFEADWIWRDAAPPDAAAFASRLSWTRVATPAGLAAWEQAWSGDIRNADETLRHAQFPAGLLGSPDHAFFAGLREGRIVAGGIANRSPGAVGLSNLFSPPELFDDTWRALTASISGAFPGLPIVGYERGADLAVARRAGFASIGKLRVWCWPA